MSSIKQVPLTCGGHTRPVVHLDFSDVTKDGYFLISACKDGKPMLRQGETGDWIGTFEGHKGAVWGVALSRSARLAASAAADFSAMVWDARTGDALHTLQHDHIVKSVHFSEDESQLVTAGNEKIARLYDVRRLDAGATQLLRGHTAPVRHALFLDERRLATVSDDRTLRIWDRLSNKEVQCVTGDGIGGSMQLARAQRLLVMAHEQTVSLICCESGEVARQLRVCEGEGDSAPARVYCAALAPDASALICAGDDLKIHKYEYASGEHVESLAGHFGPVHWLCWSPDGEVFASGSEDGTVRLWQAAPGTTYGLWRTNQAPVVSASAASGASGAGAASPAHHLHNGLEVHAN